MLQRGRRHFPGRAGGVEERTSVLGRESLAALPEELREELADATISLDTERITGVIGRISERDDALGNLLARHADRFAYTQILNALDAAGSLHHPGS